MAERLLDEIGSILVDLSSSSNVALFATVDVNFVDEAVFEESDDNIRFRWVEGSRLSHTLLALWYAYGSERRWSEITYVIKDGTFDVTYSYGDDIDPNEDSFVRRRQIIERCFGQKPIVYPPMADEEWSYVL